MLTDAEGNLGPALHLRDEASKGASGRVIPLNKVYFGAHCRSSMTCATARHTSSRQSDCSVRQLAQSRTFLPRSTEAAGVQGCSSHSGRRTFITNNGGSLTRDSEKPPIQNRRPRRSRRFSGDALPDLAQVITAQVTVPVECGDDNSITPT
jgi:hypothetical protein